MWPFKKKKEKPEQDCAEKITETIKPQAPQVHSHTTGKQSYVYTGTQSYAYGVGSCATGSRNSNPVWFSDFVFCLDLEEEKVSVILDILNEDVCGKDTYNYLVLTILQANKKKTKHFSEEFLLKYALGNVSNEIIHKFYSNEIDSGAYPALALALEL